MLTDGGRRTLLWVLFAPILDKIRSRRSVFILKCVWYMLAGQDGIGWDRIGSPFHISSRMYSIVIMIGASEGVGLGRKDLLNFWFENCFFFILTLVQEKKRFNYVIKFAFALLGFVFGLSLDQLGKQIEFLLLHVYFKFV